jgi:hypothetical protein
MNRDSDQGLTKLLWSLLAAWFFAVLVAGFIGVFDAGTRYSMSEPIPLGLSAVLPVAVFAIWFSISTRFREYLRSLNPVILTAVQTWRVGGIVFLILMAKGMLPPTFALPAGLGDMTIGITAPLIALALSRKKLADWVFVLWQAAGILDLVVAVGTGVLSSPTRLGVLAHGATTRLMGQLPMSLIPTFAVPLLVILHIVCIAQVRQAGLRSQAMRANAQHA